MKNKENIGLECERIAFTPWKSSYSEKQNVLLQHMHKKEFSILTNKWGKNLKHENEAE